MNTKESPQVQAIRERYKQSFHEKVENISSHISGLSEATDDIDEALLEAKQMLHKLAGSSGMYGYSDISKLCRDAMSLCDEKDTSRLLLSLPRLQELLEHHS